MSTATPPPSKETVVAWIGTVLAAAYFAWLGVMLLHGSSRLTALFRGAGFELPILTRFFIDHRVWLLPCIVGIPALALVLKEALMRDKRLSLMITMLAVIGVRFAVDLIVTIYYLPLFDM